MHPITILNKFFQMEAGDALSERFSKDQLTDWAEQVRRPGYKLTREQHNFLIGRRD